MTFGIETQKSFVDTWECDENNHLNIQFYWKRFGDAGQIFQQMMNREPRAWVDRHVRYHRELHAGTNTVVQSATPSSHACLVHVLSGGENNTVSATALDQFDNHDGGATPGLDQIPDQAHPRSLPLEFLQPTDPQPMLDNGMGLLSQRSVVEPQECDHRGDLLDQHYISRFSHAAPAFWQHMGATRSWMDEQNLGSVAVEMKVTKHNSIHAGMMLEIASWLSQTNDKTLTFRHQVSEIGSQRPLYSGGVTALLMGLDTRRAIPLPDFIRNMKAT